MPGRSGVTVVTMLVCLFFITHEAAGASRARHSLRPLISESGTSMAKNSDASRRENAGSYLNLERRHCEERSDEAIHSSFARRDGLLRFARNDGKCSVAPRNDSLRSDTARMTVSTRATPTTVIAREGGRSSIPEASVIESRSRGVQARGRRRWKRMTSNPVSVACIIRG